MKEDVERAVVEMTQYSSVSVQGMGHFIQLLAQHITPSEPAGGWAREG